MTTLQLILNHNQTYDLWSWESHPVVHQTARLTKQSLSSRGSVRVALLGPRGEEPKLTAIVKMAQGRNQVTALEKEYRVYTHKLKHLQGSVVPHCYGLFKGKINGEDFACLLLEYCRSPLNFTLADRNREVMLAVCKLHQAGILHGSLDDAHHIVGAGTGIRIVDFSDVLEDHHCVGAIPLLTHPNAVVASRNGCPELVLVEKIYGIVDLLASHRGPVVPPPPRFNTWA
ncbi:hypothetical protein BT96DRAFT_872549 [Gymnopus androsaceus JB14]|uniref:Protein kinase domain-containing protein n=1 Tax=Gymnopus androsaceus JB14 TaxID=1447944 RepID=A0A6A4IAI9_9AGAR|nr:hypothetical protein BT96DRAFT_872549 [Gymnopus androsaceus JB14]